jgi:uncharacterized membrane protein YozB (DUF420 family)
MSNELIYVRFLQYSVLALTVVLFWGISLAKRGRLDKHRKVMTGIVVITMVAVVGLVLSILVMGCDYPRNLKAAEAIMNVGPADMGLRVTIHRCFSSPLFVALCVTTWAGYAKYPRVHRIGARFSVLFWLGTLITAWMFF